MVSHQQNTPKKIMKRLLINFNVLKMIVPIHAHGRPQKYSFFYLFSYQKLYQQN